MSLEKNPNINPDNKPTGAPNNQAPNGEVGPVGNPVDQSSDEAADNSGSSGGGMLGKIAQWVSDAHLQGEGPSGDEPLLNDFLNEIADDYASANMPPPAEKQNQSQASSSPSLAPVSALPPEEISRFISEKQIKDRVTIALLRRAIISINKVNEAHVDQQNNQPKVALWRVLANLEDVPREPIFREAAQIYAFKVVESADAKPRPDFVKAVLDSFPQEQQDNLLRLKLLPLEYALESRANMLKLVFVTHDPTHPATNQLMRQLELERFELRYLPEDEVESMITELFPKRNEFLDRLSEEEQAFDLGTTYEEKSTVLVDQDALEAEISRSTLINLFEAVLMEGVRLGASDIHIFPNAKSETEFLLRVDGRLQRWHTEDKIHPESIIAVIKDNSTNVDRFERDLAQDGFIQRKIDEALIRFRVSILPIATANPELHAESIVIRILDDRKVVTDLAKLGLLPSALDRFKAAVSQPHGMVILTGPTGSGKSTTLVASLSQVVTPAVNVLTVEDPVEYIIPGVRQIKLSHKLNLEGALRAILRHDPDIVMVGEMRDKATAELAVKLANTGHLTFSTLHTNDAPSAVSRLYKMGLEPFLLAYAINLIVAQRLIRALCPACKKVDPEPDMLLLHEMEIPDVEIAGITFYKAGENSKCKSCKGRGYKGRRAVAEALYFSAAIRKLIVESGDAINEDEIRELATEEGMLTLRASAFELVKMGDTSLDELLRITATE